MTTVSSGMSTTQTQLPAGSELIVASGGTAALTAISKGGVEIIQSGGIGEADQILPGGLLLILPGGTEEPYGQFVQPFASATTSAIGEVYVFPGATVSGLGATMPSEIISTGLLGLSGTTIVYQATTVDETTVSSGLAVYVLSSGGLRDSIVTAGGSVSVYNDGSTDEDTLQSGGQEVVFSGGVVSRTTISSGSELLVSSGGQVSGGTLSSGGELGLFAGGHVSGVVVAGGASVTVVASSFASALSLRTSAELTVLSGGSESGSTLDGGSAEIISSGGMAVGDLVSGIETVEFGGSATDVDLLLQGVLDLTSFAFSDKASATIDRSTDILTLTEPGSSTTVQLAGSYAGEGFELLGDKTGGTNILVDRAACYCHGTLILTDRGEIAAEALQAGDMAITLSGARRSIRWIGRRSYAGRFLPNNPRLLPVRFRAGSLGGGLPRRDLLVSPEHAMFLDGVLIPARCLVNGVTIVRETGLKRVDYVHIELDEHDVIFAEGAASESFVDDGTRSLFQNAHSADRASPDRPALYCAPRLEQGSLLDLVRRRLSPPARRTDCAA